MALPETSLPGPFVVATVLRVTAGAAVRDIAGA
jgi:hypothetical protein